MCVYIIEVLGVPNQVHINRAVDINFSMKKSAVGWLLWALIVLVFIDGNRAAAVCLQHERTALLTLKAFLQSEDSGGDYLLPSWVTDGVSNCCRWEGVTCDSTTSHVTTLSLTRLSSQWILNLTLFCPFKNLKSLNLSYNFFVEIVHDMECFSTLKKLRTLDLARNRFDKKVFMALMPLLRSLEDLNVSQNYDIISLGAEELSNFTNLKTLDLSYNLLNDSLTAPEWCTLRSLHELRLNGNACQGELPPCFGNLTSLRVLDLNGNNLQGKLPSWLGNLTSLQILDLGGNSFQGELPSSIDNLTSLQIIDLTENQLSGNISASTFTTLTSLQSLSLSGNYFGGLISLSCLANHSKLEMLQLAMYGNKFQVETENVPWVPTFQLKVLHMPNCSLNAIPSFLFNQHRLEDIDLSHNQMVGTFTDLFPTPDKCLHWLIRLDISKNKIRGQLPQDIGLFLPNLVELYMSHNLFHGIIPSSFGNISRLMILGLDYNNFSGEVPRQLVSSCTSLRILVLSNNNLHGQFFSNYWNLSNLRLLLIENNHFNGSLHFPLTSDLGGLDISNNQFSGNLSIWLGGLTNVNVLSMFGNKFEGDIPQELCDMESLEYINLSQNRLSGYIPSCLNQSYLAYVHLQRNGLVGLIPEAFSKMQNLVTLDLRDNKLSGNFPNWINQLDNLKFLLLSGHHFEGQLHTQLCQLKQLKFLDLSHNNFIGSIPLCFNNISFSQSEDIKIHFFYSIILDGSNVAEPVLKFFTTQYEEEEKEAVEFRTKSVSLLYKGTILKYISGIDLSSNQFTGQIPEQLGKLITIQALNLSRNNLSGFIPASLSKLQNVESLDLSYNNLSGEIPPQLVKFHSLAVFNVSYNNLFGDTPSEGQFATFDESSYIGNVDLHWSLVNDKSRGTAMASIGEEDKEDDDTIIDMVAFYCSFGATYVTALATVVVVLCINPRWRALWFYYIERCVGALQVFIGF